MSVATSTAIAIGVTAAGAGASAYGASKQAGAAKAGARMQTNAATRAAEIEGQAQRDSLAFLQQQEATRKQEFDSTQAQNLSNYTDERDFRRNQLAPYQRAGIGSLGQLARPIQNIPSTGRLGDLVKG